MGQKFNRFSLTCFAIHSVTGSRIFNSQRLAVPDLVGWRTEASLLEVTGREAVKALGLRK